jgi:WD40 repeat protein
MSEDGKHLVVASFEGRATILDAGGRQVQVLEEGEGFSIEGVAFSPDGRSIATAVFNGLKPREAHVSLWDWERGQIDRTIKPIGARSVEFDPTGSTLAVGRFDGVVEIRKVPGGERVLQFPAHSGAVGDIAFSPDGTRIATSGEDPTVGLFDAETGEQQLVLRGHTFQVTGIAFSPDGTQLASASPDGVVRVWVLDLDDLIRIAERKLTRELSDDECRQYLHLQGGCA